MYYITMHPIDAALILPVFTFVLQQLKHVFGSD